MNNSSTSDQTRWKSLHDELAADTNKALAFVVLILAIIFALVFLLSASTSDRRDVESKLNDAHAQIAALKEELSTAKQDGARAAYHECFLHLQMVKP